MSKVTQTSEGKESSIEECYLCNLDVSLDKSMEVPLTTGGNVRVHPSCMEFYMSSTTSVPACGSCTGEKGCC